MTKTTCHSCQPLTIFGGSVPRNNSSGEAPSKAISRLNQTELYKKKIKEIKMKLLPSFSIQTRIIHHICKEENLRTIAEQCPGIKTT